jgi:hypothetical protein
MTSVRVDVPDPRADVQTRIHRVTSTASSRAVIEGFAKKEFGQMEFRVRSCAAIFYHPSAMV